MKNPASASTNKSSRGIFSPPSARPMSRDKADTLLLLVTCALVLAPHAGHLPGWIIVACTALLAWRTWITFRGNRMPPLPLLLPVAVASMLGVYWTYKTILGREPGVSMLVLLLALKLLEMHAKRDLFVVLFLSFFIVLTRFFYSQTIGAALMTVIAVLAILTTQLSFQYTGTVPPLKQRLRLGAFILMLAAPLMLVLFVLFPRIQGPLWGMPKDAQSARSGLSDTMSPGNISKLALSDDIAFRVKFLDPLPPKSKLYWRGPVLGYYDGRTWMPLDDVIKRNQPLILTPRGGLTHYQVTLEPNGRSRLFALEMPQSVPVLPDNPTGAGTDLELLTKMPINERVRYDVASYTDFHLQQEISPTALKPWLELPQDLNARTRAFAANLRSESSDNTKVIDTVLVFFREENFRYTLEPPLLGPDAVDDFLFNTRAGFCEHYSSAFVVLMRAMGIPARVVTGYQGGELNPSDGYLVVRQSDAHAWAEVWLAGRGWIRVDPTAAVSPDRIEKNLRTAVPQETTFGGLITLDNTNNAWLSSLYSLRQNWEAVTNAWNQRVLNYTPEKQRNLLQSLGFSSPDWRTLISVMAVFGILVMAMVALPLVINRPAYDPLESIYRALCERLAKQGYARLIHEGPRDYRHRLAATDSLLSPEKKAAAARFLELYETARYGSPADGKRSTTLIISKLKSLLAQCR